MPTQLHIQNNPFGSKQRVRKIISWFLIIILGLPTVHSWRCRYAMIELCILTRQLIFIFLIFIRRLECELQLTEYSYIRDMCHWNTTFDYKIWSMRFHNVHTVINSTKIFSRTRVTKNMSFVYEMQVLLSSQNEN